MIDDLPSRVDENDGSKHDKAIIYPIEKISRGNKTQICPIPKSSPSTRQARENESKLKMTRMYDCATWDMYQRITMARKSKRLIALNAAVTTYNPRDSKQKLSQKECDSLSPKIKTNDIVEQKELIALCPCHLHRAQASLYPSPSTSDTSRLWLPSTKPVTEVIAHRPKYCYETMASSTHVEEMETENYISGDEDFIFPLEM